MSSKTLMVAWREFKHTALTKAFIIAAVVAPVMMFALAIALPIFFKDPPKPLVGTLALVDPSGKLVEAFEYEFDADRIRKANEAKAQGLESAVELTLDPATQELLDKQLGRIQSSVVPEVDIERSDDAGEQALNDLKERLRTDDLLAVAIVDESALTTSPQSNVYKLYVRSTMSRSHLDLLQNTISRSIVRARADAKSLILEEVQAVLRSPQPITTSLTEEGREATENALAKAFLPGIFLLLIFMGSFISGNYLLTSTIEEKSNRVIEVLLSAVSPFQLMTGKILGQGLVGLTITAIYAGVGGLLAHRTGFGNLIPLELFGYLALYFFMAYFIVASMFAAIGSAVTELRDAQSLLMPATLILMVPWFAWFLIGDEPNSTFATVLSFIPPLTPFVMIIRVTAAEPVPVWQLVATGVLGYATVFVMIWMCSRIFRVGLLMQGKPPTPVELIKWLRYK